MPRHRLFSTQGRNHKYRCGKFVAPDKYLGERFAVTPLDIVEQDQQQRDGCGRNQGPRQSFK